ncbi:MAG: hypothetical protein JF588_05415 [Caulobacterales bacterium]|nr:hypothetical protein [Caulobacterales bacterium]
MPVQSFLRLVRWAALALGLLAGAPAMAADLPGGPTSLLISYRAEPSNRPAFRAYLQGPETALLDRLKREGVLKSYQVLFNPFVTGTWDAMTVLSFSSYTATQRWKEIERTRPGGLDAAGLKLARPLETYSADLAWEGEAADGGPPGNRVVYVIPYSYTALDQYKAYVDAYVIPQVKGWMADGVLSRYGLFLNRDPVGDPWDALFVYEYRDLASFGRREEVVAKVRAPLREDPAWKHWNEIKSTVRSESQNTQAEILSAGK